MNVETAVVRIRMRRRWLHLLAAAALTLAALAAFLDGARAQEDAVRAETPVTEADYARIVQAAIDLHVRPVHERFAQQAELLELEVGGFCADPSAENRLAVERAFGNSLRALAALEPSRYGPMLEENRRERLAFWPDPRGIGLKQVQRVLADEDPSAASAASLAGKSVGVQGLTALEYLLYGSGSEALMEKGAFRCRFAEAIAGNVRSIADDLMAAWEEGGDAVALFTEPGPRNPLFLDHKEAAGEVFSAVATAMEVIADQKLRPVLGADPASAKPRLAPFWRSGSTLPMIVSTLEASQHLLEVSGALDLLEPEEDWLGNSILFELGNATKTARSITAPVEVVVTDPASREAALFLRIVVNSLKRSIGRELTAAIGLEQGFNALDGD